MIVARDLDGVIGYQGDMPWGRSLKSDLRRFRDLTMGHAIIMGRRTFESIGRPLASRQNIVVTSSAVEIENVQTAGDLETACNLVEPSRDTFVIGGARLYREALWAADTVYQTVVQGHFSGDVFFAELNTSQWVMAHEQMVSVSNDDAFALLFQTWKRRGVK